MLLVGLSTGSLGLVLLLKHHVHASLDTRAGSLPGLTVETAGRRLLVTSVRTGSAAELQGVAAGDAIATVAGRPFASSDALRSYLTHFPRRTIRIALLRHGGLRRIDLPPTEGPRGGQDPDR